MANSKDFNLIIQNLGIFISVYDIIRIVNPLYKTARVISENEIINQKGSCFDFWKQNKICENCISMRSYIENESFVKIEFNGEKLYIVMSVPVEIGSEKLVIELLKDVTGKIFIEDIDLSDVQLTYQKINKLNELVVKDSLTGLYNRRFIDERLDVEIIRASFSKSYFSIAMADIDYFKKVNDTYGHTAGDKVLQTFADIIRKNIRIESDWAARYGGEEFLIFFQNQKSINAFEIAERIRKELENTVIKLENFEIKITASFGISSLENYSMTSKELIKIADEKLYYAKNSGRNKVVI